MGTHRVTLMGTHTHSTGGRSEQIALCSFVRSARQDQNPPSPTVALMVRSPVLRTAPGFCFLEHPERQIVFATSQ
jgi:hypothetical protein